jgi:para-nitrobenzyl esterase
MARAAARSGAEVHVYEFGWESPAPGLGACHCIDLPFTFGNLFAWEGAPLLQGADARDMDRLAGNVMTRWGEFIRTGSPGFASWSRSGEGPVFHLDEPDRSAAA